VKKKGNIAQAIGMTRHHVAPHKARLMHSAGALDLDSVQYRFRLVDENLEQVEQQLYKIREAASQGDCEAVLTALDESIEFGHDISA